MKRKYLIGAAVVILAAVWLAFFAPHRLFRADANVRYIRCEYYSEAHGEYLDLTAEQAAEVVAILQPLWCFRVWGESSRSLDEMVLEITLFVDGQPLYVVLGRRDYCYSGTHGPFQQFEIIGGDKATEQILALLGLDEERING